jgi:MFS family permease
VIVGTVLTVAYIPTIALLALGGVVADRFSRRVIVLWSDLLRAVETLVFAVLVALGHLALPTVFILVVAYGIFAAFFNPALIALYPSLVEPENYARANSLRQISVNVAALAGPVLGGYLVARFSVTAALGCDVATFLAAALATLRMGRATSPGPPEATPEQPRQASGILAGVRFLRAEPGLLIMMLFFSLTNGLNDVMVVLVPFLVQRVLRLPASAYGLMGTCAGLGFFGGAILAMGVAPGVLALDGAFVSAGVGFMVPEIIIGTFLQRIIPPDMRGRVFSVIGAVAMAMNPLGMLLAGALGQRFGPRGGLLIGGGAIVALALCMYLVPAVRNLDRRADPTASIVAEVAEHTTVRAPEA